MSTTALTEGPQLGLTASNVDYASRVYSVFTDFGTPAAGGIPGRPGLSGVQGLGGEFLIRPPAGMTTAAVMPSSRTISKPSPTFSSLGRRFDDIAFDQYGYFSQGFTLTTSTNTATGTAATTNNGNLITTSAGSFTIGLPQYAGSVFVADLATGLQVSVTPIAPLPATAINVPVQGNGPIGVESDGAGGVTPILTNDNTTGGGTSTFANAPTQIIGGRILRIQPNGVATVFAEGFNVSPAIRIRRASPTRRPGAS